LAPVAKGYMKLRIIKFIVREWFLALLFITLITSTVYAYDSALLPGGPISRMGRGMDAMTNLPAFILWTVGSFYLMYLFIFKKDRGKKNSGREILIAKVISILMFISVVIFVINKWK
jgi:hypothetical protein